MQLESVMSLFDADVRSRGARYAREERVTFSHVGPTEFEAVVRGMRHYRVSFESTDEGVDLACGCPYFRDRGPCKHLWAAFLKAADALNGPDPFDPPDLLEERWQDDGERPFLPPGPPDRSGWREALQGLRAAEPRPSRVDPETQIAYHILKRATLEDGHVTIALTSSRPRKDGNGWTKPRPLRMTVKAIEQLPDVNDQHILATLHGALGDGGYGFYRPSQSLEPSYKLPAVVTNMLLPLIASTGRLVFEDEVTGQEKALRLDESAPWQFHLEVGLDEATQDCVTTGLLRRGDEAMPVAAPDLLLANGWLVVGEDLARLEYGDNFGWIVLLRRDQELRVSPAELKDWLPEFLECSRPPTDLPEALEFTQEDTPPQACLSLIQGVGDETPVRLGAILQFRYGTREVAWDAPERVLYDTERRTMCARDAQAEGALYDVMLALPFRARRSSSQIWFSRRVHAEISAAHLQGAVTALMDAGWSVEVEGAACKRPSSVKINVASGTDWFDLNGHVQFGEEKIPMPRILQAAKSDSRMIKLRDGGAGMLPEEWLRRLGLLVAMGGEKGRPLRFAKTQTFLLDALLSQQPGVSWDESSRRLRDSLRSFDGIEPGHEAEAFHGVLRDYQREGLGWFGFLQEFGFGGCLADDMGLGKTVQALALLQHRHQEERGLSLVVAPSSVVPNWVDEAERFVPQLPCVNHTGQGRASDPASLPASGLLVTSYAIMRRDIAWLKDVPFDYAILDEAQAIKNTQTATSKAARLLSASHRLAMSGTPIENHLGELWSLFEFMNPGMLGSGTAFESLLKTGGLGVDKESRNLLRHAVRPFIMRRTKEQVAQELPDKTEETIFCELPVSQRKIYDELRDYYRQALKEKVADSGMGRSKIVVLEALLRLRQVACHPALVDKKYERKPSAKLDLLLEQLEDVTAEGHKVLVFSQFTTLLGIVRKRLEQRKITYEYLDGRTRDRAARVKHFQEDPECPVFLISLKAGGVGLNLTAADYVILLDPWWNPAVEAQAIDRTHRIGQTRKVFAYRLVAKDTVEERILELQDRKRDLADSIIKADNNLIRSLTPEDLEHLLS